MPAVVLILIAIAVAVVGYFTYGTYVAAQFGLDDSRPTPAHTHADGVDFVASRRPLVLGHHFASIAGAGPIVGPIIAVSFGWLPAFIWILVGALFVGAVHDMSTLTASIRHDGRTISDIVEDYVGLPAKRLFVLFGFSALILVVGVFTDIVARTFVAQPAVASTSVFFIVLAVGFGFAIRNWKAPLFIATLFGVAGLGACIALGARFPIEASYNVWGVAVFAYVAVAALSPVWVLLQPRDYLNSFLLYGMLGAGTLGLFVAHPRIEMEAFTGMNHPTLGFIFPILFVTVACGAISGFHSLVASGTTSKQLDRESDAKFIGFGGMLLEGVLAVLALIAAGVLTSDAHSAALASGGPIGIFSSGVGGFISMLGFEADAAVRFVALGVSAFALTSLDTCTRLARIMFAEFFSTAQTRADGRPAGGGIGLRVLGTVVVVALGAALTFSNQFLAIWPIFGAANQLLAALALLSVAVWMSNNGKNPAMVVAPMVFMFAVTFVALAQLCWTNIQAQNVVLAVLSACLLVMSVVLIAQASIAVGAKSRETAS